MILELDLHGGVPIYRQVMDQVRRQILTGQLAAGDQILSVKSLSAQLKVNPMTISKAYGFLVDEGLLERRRGVGLFVRPIRMDSKRRQQEQLLDRALSKVAALVVQTGLSMEEAQELFAQHYRKYDSPRESDQS